MSVVATVPTAANGYEVHNTMEIELSGYHFHHNRCPFYILFGKKGKNIYIEKVDSHSGRNKYVNDMLCRLRKWRKMKVLRSITICQ